MLSTVVRQVYYYQFNGKNILDSSRQRSYAGFSGWSRGEIKRVADAIISHPNKLKPVAICSVYGDESSGSHTFVLSVLIGTVEHWECFEVPWKSILLDAGLVDPQEPGVPLPFHMSEFESRIPPFDWDNEKRIKVLSSLISVIHGAQLIAASVILPIKLFQNIIPVNAHLSLDDPLRKALQWMICFAALHHPLAEFARSLSEPMPLVFDRNDFAAGMIQDGMTRVHTRIPELEKLLDVPVFRNKSRVVQIQAADILAYETMKHYENGVTLSGRPLRKSRKLLHDGLPLFSFVCGERHLSDMRSVCIEAFRSWELQQ